MTFFDDYELSKELGRGGYGRVYVALSKKRGDNGSYVAKFFDVDGITEKRIRRIDQNIQNKKITLQQGKAMKRRVYATVYDDMKREFEILKLLTKHNIPHTVRYVAEYPDVLFEGRRYYVIVMSRVNGFTLSALVDCFHKYKAQLKNPHIPKTFLRKITYDLIKTLVKLHDVNIVHRDIKTANIMYDTIKKSITYIDFGFSCMTVTPRQDLLCEKRTMGSVGSYPPEVIDGRFKKESLEALKAIDMWELGITLYRLENLERPFKSDKDTLDNNRKPSSGPDPLMNDLIEKILVYDFRKRPTAQEILDYYSAALSQEY